MTANRAAFYARVSSEQQATAHTIESQISALNERAKLMERSRRGKRHAAQSGSLNVMSGAPFGYRYVSVREGGGQARFEPIAEQVRVVQRIFS
jgi:DNA invertase Pin-like site-specific DNA recombinase